jgi:ABC-type sugar transport system ATPase subunit
MGIESPVVEVVGVALRYGGAQALMGVTVALRAGEVHALVGENGAGKSTLGKIIAGVVRPDAGGVRVDGEPVTFRAPRDALRHGIAIVEQELALVPAMTAAENVVLGFDPQRERGQRRRDRDRVAHVMDELGLAIDLSVPVERLTLVDQQKVEVVRAVCRGARLVVMDEPTARLPSHDAAALLDLMRLLAQRGTAIVFVSHFLEEVLSVADRVTVLRDGHHVETVDAAGRTPDDLVTTMLGRQATLAFPVKRAPHADARVVLSLEGLSGANGVRDVSLSVREGEIVALAGLVGSGRSEVGRLVFGADARTGGTIELDGRPLRPRAPRDAIARGVAYLPESRKDAGLFLSRSSCENITLPYLATVSRMGCVSRRAELRESQAILDRLAVKPASPRREVRTLSGGNQQKVLFAKWLWHRPRLLIADEPTRGVDVGAKFAIYELLCELAASGMAILLISSELEEVLGLAHRVVVMRRGRHVTTLAGDRLDEDSILRAAFGGQQERVGEAAA